MTELIQLVASFVGAMGFSLIFGLRTAKTQFMGRLTTGEWCGNFGAKRAAWDIPKVISPLDSP